jgi:mono/diheme cytochrome c family protein
MKSNPIIPLALIAVLAWSAGTVPTHAAEAKEAWATHCAACHGKDGKGQTKAGRMAGTKDQTDAAYQEGLKDDKMFAAVKDGLKEGGKEKMKPFKEKLTDDEIKALIAYVRSFKK